MRLEVKLTGAETFEAKMIPLDNPGATFTHAGTLANPGFSIDWIEFLFFNTQSEQGSDTDFVICSIQIVESVPGDYNNDGTVNAADYVTWRTGGPLQNDPTPGVQPADYDLWRARFGNDEVGAASLAARAPVPEPGTFVYLVVAACASAELAAHVRNRFSSRQTSDAS